MFSDASFAATPIASIQYYNVAVVVTGVAGTGQLGAVSVVSGNDISVGVSGVLGTGAVGTATQASRYPVTGVLATGQTGSLTVTSAVTFAVTGVSATGRLGTVNAFSPVLVTGVEARCYTYTPQIWVKINTTSSDIWTLIAA